MKVYLKSYCMYLKKTVCLLLCFNLLFLTPFFSLNCLAAEESETNNALDFGKDENKQEQEIMNLQKPAVLKGYVSKIPSGTKLKIILETPIDELNSMLDDEVIARIAEDVVIDGKVAVPAGSTVVGIISEINAAKRLHKAGNVRIGFKSLTMPDGRQAPIVASVLSRSGLVKGKYTKKTALISGATILGPAAAGFGAGLAAEGSAVGATVGAVAGVVAGLALFAFQRGNMIDIMAGDEMDIELVEEVKVPQVDSEMTETPEPELFPDAMDIIMNEKLKPEVNEIDFSDSSSPQENTSDSTESKE